MAFGMASFIGLLFVLPLYLQGLRGLDPFDSGLTTFPQAIGILISSQIAGRIYAAVGPRRLIVGGMLGAAVSMAACCSSAWRPTCGGSAALIFPAAWPWASRSCRRRRRATPEIAPADNGRASAIFSTQRQMSVSIGIALMATVLSGFTTLTAAPTDPQRALDGYHWTFAVCVGLALVSRAAGVPDDPRRGRRRDDARHGTPAASRSRDTAARAAVTDSTRQPTTMTTAGHGIAPDGDARPVQRPRIRLRRVRAVGVVAQALLALGDRAGADALRGRRTGRTGGA